MELQEQLHKTAKNAKNDKNDKIAKNDKNDKNAKNEISWILISSDFEKTFITLEP